MHLAAKRHPHYSNSNINTHTFSFNGAKNTGPDTVDWTLTPPAVERTLTVRSLKAASLNTTTFCIKSTQTYQTLFKAELECSGNLNM